MKLVEMFPIQKELDSHILVKFPELQGVNLLDKKVLSLQIELGEMANELPEVFKFWSHKKNQYANALEEYVDCLHFILSIGNDIEFTDLRMGTTTTDNYGLSYIGFSDARMDISATDSIVLSFIGLQEAILNMHRAYYLEDNLHTHYQILLDEFIRLGELVGFSWEEIEQAYFDKNKKNYKRQADGY